MNESLIAVLIFGMIFGAFFIGSARGQKMGEDNARRALVDAIIKSPEDRDDNERILVDSIKDHLAYEGWTG